MGLWNKLVKSLGEYEEPEQEEIPDRVSSDPYQEAADILDVGKEFLMRRLSANPVTKTEAAECLGLHHRVVGIARQIQFTSEQAWAKRTLGLSDEEMNLIEKLRTGGSQELLKELVKEPKTLVDFLSYCYSYTKENMAEDSPADADYHLEQARLEITDLKVMGRKRSPKQLLNSYAEIVLRVYAAFLKTFKNG